MWSDFRARGLGKIFLENVVKFDGWILRLEVKGAGYILLLLTSFVEAM